MNGRPRPHINLASRPVRNRRFYFAALGGMMAVFVLAAAVLGLWLVRASSRASADAKAAAAASLRSSDTERERLDFVGRADALQRRERDLVAQVNQAIARKRFSYVEFFALLEEALPARCYIAALTPVSAPEGRIENRLRVVTAGLEDLMGLMTRLENLKFKNVMMKGEIQVGGELVAEIGLVYEKAH
ncbi:MAG: hypothetical protein FJY82_00355 [Candidatus Aminicenantes bacterium]|nr:hypothetical protein [Candidatus Aminicenantes bacterium]